MRDAREFPQTRSATPAKLPTGSHACKVNKDHVPGLVGGGAIADLDSLITCEWKVAET